MLIRVADKTYRLPKHIPANVLDALIRWGTLTKSVVLYKAVDEPDYKWITVHPGGDDSKGMPIKIRVNSDGTGTVVGGAGGKLNAMKLTRLRSEKEWKQTARERQQAKQQRNEALPEHAKAAKAEAAEQLASAKEEATAEYLAAISEAQGWEESVRLPDDIAQQMPEKQRARFERARQKSAMAEVDKRIAEEEEKLLKYHNDKRAAEMGEVSLGDIDTSAQKDTTGLGYMDSLKAFAEENGLGGEEAGELSEETRLASFAAAEESGYIADAEIAEEMTQKLLAGAASAREADKPLREEGLHRVKGAEKPIDPAKLKDVLMARQEYKQKMAAVNSEINKLGRASDADQVLEITKGVSLVVSQNIGKRDREQLEEALKADFHQKNMKQSLDTLMSTIEDAQENHPAAAPAEEHINTGRYAEMMDIAQGIMQEPCPIDRLVADHIGLDATATLLANTWKEKYKDSPAMFRAIRNGLERAHTATVEDLQEINEERAVQNLRPAETQAQIARGAATRGAALIKQADAMVAGMKTLSDCDADDLMMVQQLNEQRKELLDEAASTLGEALGRLEFIGTLNFAMMNDNPAEIKASLGQISSKQAHQLAAAFGLDAGEHEVVSDLNNKYLRIAPEAEYKLLNPPSPEAAQDYKDAVAIKSGEQDEDGWLPAGFRDPSQEITYPEAEAAFAFKRDIALDTGMAPDAVQEETFDFLDRALADNPYNPRAVRREATTQAFISQNVPNDLQRAYNDAIRDYFPPDDLDTDEQAAWYAERTEAARQKMIHRGELAEDVPTLGAQTIILGHITDETVHATLTEMPEAAMAFAPVSEDNRHQVQSALRDYFWEHLTADSREDATTAREAVRTAQTRAEETAGVQTNIFGEEIEVARGAAEGEPTEAPPDAWERFVSSFSSVSDAHDAVRDHMRGAFLETFAKQYGSRTGAALKAGTKQVPNWDRFTIGTMTAEERERKIEEETSRRAKIGANVALRDEKGKFLPGERRKFVDKILQDERNAHQSSFGFDFDDDADKDEYKPLSERATLGDGVEQQLAAIMPQLAVNFRPGQAVSLPPAVSMDGKYAPQQRAVKLVERQGRVGVHAGVGSGKTLMGLGSFTNLQKQGKVSKGIFAVPSVVAGQFGSEALRFLEPHSADGTRGYRWKVAAGMPLSQRLAAYKDPKVDMVFVTHQAMRDDIVYEVAQQRFGGDVTAAATWMRQTKEEERRPQVQEALKDAGWTFDFSMIDEGHDLLNRVGKPNSVMANALDDLTTAHDYHVNATGTPVKNDTSEAFDVLHKLRPDLYPKSRYKEFHRRYGLDTKATREALQREMAPYVYATKISPDSEMVVKDHEIKLSKHQGDAYREVLASYRKAQVAEPGSPEHVAALRTLSPRSFEGATDEEAKAIAVERGSAAGMLRDIALSRIQNASDDVPPEQNAKLQHVMATAQEYAAKDDDGGQLPGIVFAHNLASCRMLKKQMEKAGYRVGILTGENQSTEKEVARLNFHPPLDTDGMSPAERAKASREAAKSDILIASDAAACGANLQRAGWLYHYDQPMTAKTHEQRTGRMHRIGQLREQVYVHNAIADTPLDKRNAQRVKDKYELGSTFQEATELLDDTGRAGLIRSMYHHNLEQDARKITNTSEAAA